MTTLEQQLLDALLDAQWVLRDVFKRGAPQSPYLWPALVRVNEAIAATGTTLDETDTEFWRVAMARQLTSNPLHEMSDEALEHRGNVLERLIAKETDWKKLPHLNRLLQLVMDEQVRRDLLDRKETA